MTKNTKVFLLKLKYEKNEKIINISVKPLDPSLCSEWKITNMIWIDFTEFAGRSK